MLVAVNSNSQADWLGLFSNQGEASIRIKSALLLTKPGHIKVSSKANFSYTAP